MKATVLSLFTVSTIMLVGCHTCPPQDDPKFLECYPVCRKFQEKNAENIQEKWETFQNVRVYCPTQTAYPSMDNLNMLVAKLSDRVKEEIVVPYIELDRECLISYYMEFGLAVQKAMKSQQCDTRTAVSLVFTQWLKLPNGQEKITKLLAAYPVLERLEQKKDILNIAAALAPELKQLGSNIGMLRRDAKEIKADFKNYFRDPYARARLNQFAVAAGQALANVDTLTTALGFLSIYEGDLRSQREVIEAHSRELARIYKINHN